MNAKCEAGISSALRAGVVGAVLAAGALLGTRPALADCGPLPGPVAISRNFAVGWKKYDSATKQQKYDGSGDANIPIGDLPVGFAGENHYSTDERNVHWSELNLEEASSYVQGELSANVELARACGYYLCKMAEGGGVAALGGQNLLTQVCLASGTPPGTDMPGEGPGANFRPQIGDSLKQAFGSVYFDSDAPVTTTHVIYNAFPTTMVVTYWMEGAQKRDGSSFVSLSRPSLRPGGKPRRLPRVIRIRPGASFLVDVTVSRPDRPVERPKIWFAIAGYESYAANLQYVVVRDRVQLDQPDCTKWDVENDALSCKQCRWRASGDPEIPFASTSTFRASCSRMPAGAEVEVTANGVVYCGTWSSQMGFPTTCGYPSPSYDWSLYLRLMVNGQEDAPWSTWFNLTGRNQRVSLRDDGIVPDNGRVTTRIQTNDNHFWPNVPTTTVIEHGFEIVTSVVE